MPRMHLPLKLRSRLLLLVLLAVLPALGLTLYTAAESRQQAAGQVRQDALTLIQVISADQERVIEGARQLLISLAQLRDVRGGDPAACAARLVELLPQFAGYTGLGAVAPDGTLFCSTVDQPQTTNVSDRAWFQRAVATRSFAVGDYQVGRVTGQAILVFAYPVFDTTQELHAVVFAVLQLAALNQLADEANLARALSCSWWTAMAR